MENSSLSTIKLEIQGVSIECNRLDLVQHSDYFKAMLEGNFIESGQTSITLNGIEMESMKIILLLLQDKEHVIEEENLLSVLQAACMLQFLEIKEICLDRLHTFLSVETCLKIWQYTEHLDLKKICGKAKLMALLEFVVVKDTSYFLELSLNEVTNYLGSVYLQCPNEISVFEATIRWFQNLEEQSVDILLKLLHCIDFGAVSVDEIHKMALKETVCEFEVIVDILNCAAMVKSGEEMLEFKKQCVDHAKSLLKSKSRNSEGQPCVLVQSVGERPTSHQGFCYDSFKRKRKCSVLASNPLHLFIASYDVGTLSFNKLYEIDTKLCENLDGFQITGYKNLIFVYGGEFLLGKGAWNSDFHIYDVIEEKWTQEKLPYARRHFESCVSGKRLYVVGGTGYFRVIQENIFWYDIEEGEWHGLVDLPCSGRQIKCCNFRNKLFVLNMNNKCGYMFQPEDKSWAIISISDPENLLQFYSEKLSLFTYKNHMYIRTPCYVRGTLRNKLFQLDAEDDKLIILRHCLLPEVFRCNSITQVETVFCGNILYSLNKHSCDEENEQPTVSLELLNVDDCQVTNGCPQIDGAVLEIDGEALKFKASLTLFSVFHANLFKRNDLVNSLC